MKFLITLTILLVLSTAVFAVEAERRHRRKHHKKSHTKMFFDIKVDYEDVQKDGVQFSGSGESGIGAYKSVDAEGSESESLDGLKVPFTNGDGESESWYIDFTQVENCNFVGSNNWGRDTIIFTWKALHSQFTSEDSFKTTMLYGLLHSSDVMKLSSEYREACMIRQNTVNNLLSTIKTTAKDVSQAKVVLDEFNTNKQLKSDQYDEWISADQDEINTLSQQKTKLNEASLEATSSLNDLVKKINEKNDELTELLQQVKELQDGIDMLQLSQAAHEGEVVAAKEGAKKAKTQIDALNENIQRHQLNKSIVNITPEDIKSTQDNYDSGVEALKASVDAFQHAVNYNDDMRSTETRAQISDAIVEHSIEGELTNDDFNYKLNYEDGGYISSVWSDLSVDERKRARKAKLAKRKAKRASRKQKSSRRARRSAKKSRKARRHH